jgi:hypothetical protein
MPVPAAALKKLTLARQVVYLLVAAAVIVPLVAKLDPGDFRPGPRAKMLFDKVDSLPPGTRVLLSFDFDPGSDAELTPMGVAILRHCFKKGLIPLVMTNYPAGLDLARRILESSVEDSQKLWGKKKVSGKDYIFLGFRPGGTSLVFKMGENIRNAFPNDYYGKATADMDALEPIRSLKDLKLVIDLSSSNWVEVWIMYGSDRFGFEYGAGATAVMAPDLYPFLESGQMVGLLGGLRGAADYEVLLEQKDKGTLGMSAQSATHVLLILLVLGANIRFVYRRLTGREKG